LKIPTYLQKEPHLPNILFASAFAFLFLQTFTRNGMLFSGKATTHRKSELILKSEYLMALLTPSKSKITIVKWFLIAFIFHLVISVSFNLFAEQSPQLIITENLAEQSPQSINTDNPELIENIEQNQDNQIENSEDSANTTANELENPLMDTPAVTKRKKLSTSFYEDFKQQQEETLIKSKEAADENQKNISLRLHRFSNYIDQYFAEENFIEESTDSRMRVSITNTYQKYYDPTFQPRVSLSLALPNTQNRWRIRFQSNDDIDSSEGNNSDTNLIDSLNETTYSTAISGIIKASELVNIRLDAGIKFRTPIDPFTNLRFRRSFLFGKTELNLTEILQWRDSEGKTAGSALKIKYPFTINYSFLSNSEVVYWDVDSYWSQSQSFSLYQQLDQRSIIAYSVGVRAQDEDSLHLRKKDQVNEYWVELNYRKNFYQDWLFYQVSPGLVRPRDFDFETLPRLELKLEVLYGNL